MLSRFLLLAFVALPVSLARAADAPPKPHILGLARVAFYVHDMQKSLPFYRDYLSFEPYDLKTTPPSVLIPISDEQFIELRENPDAHDRLASLSFATDDAEGLREQLAAKGIKVPAATEKLPTSETAFSITDADNHTLQFLQDGRHEPIVTVLNTRIATSFNHAGILVGNLDASLHFYCDLLGFHELWRGSKGATNLSWVHLTVPNGSNYVEFMLYSALPEPDRRGTEHHLCLVVPNVLQTYKDLGTRRLPDGVKPPTPPKVGFNHKRQINLYDPDGTRIEIMDAYTVDGISPPPSTLPAPTHPTTQPTSQPH